MHYYQLWVAGKGPQFFNNLVVTKEILKLNLHYYKNKARKDNLTARCKVCSKEDVKCYRVNNRDKINALKSKRKAVKLQRTVEWSDSSKIQEFYTEANRLKKLTGIDFHVDHYYPLQGDTVSGLHVPENLQILPGYENIRKSNKHPESL